MYMQVREGTSILYGKAIMRCGIHYLIVLKVSGLFAPRYFRSSERKFPVGTFAPRNESSRELLLPGTNVPGNESSRELSFLV